MINDINSAKIIACHGHVTCKSISKMLGVSIILVYRVLADAELKPKDVKTMRKNPYI